MNTIEPFLYGRREDAYKQYDFPYVSGIFGSEERHDSFELVSFSEADLDFAALAGWLDLDGECNGLLDHARGLVEFRRLRSRS